MRLSRFLKVAALAGCVFGGALAAFAQETPSSYTVQAYDTLDGIAATFDIQLNCLAQANDLMKPGELKPGQTLVIDQSCPRYDGLDTVRNPRTDVGSGGGGEASSDLGQGGGAVEPGPDDTTYTVERGDTLDTIGQSMDISVVSLQVTNNIEPGDKIMPGQTLVIPADAAKYGEFPALGATGSSDLGQGGGGPEVGPTDQLYVVQLQDTLDTIGARFDTKTSCIAEGNSLEAASRIYPGQSLVIQSSCPRYDGYDVVINPREGT